MINKNLVNYIATYLNDKSEAESLYDLLSTHTIICENCGSYDILIKGHCDIPLTEKMIDQYFKFKSRGLKISKTNIGNLEDYQINWKEFRVKLKGEI